MLANKCYIILPSWGLSLKCTRGGLTFWWYRVTEFVPHAKTLKCSCSKQEDGVNTAALSGGSVPVEERLVRTKAVGSGGTSIGSIAKKSKSF